jgi:PST family polysaccharide transporter
MDKSDRSGAASGGHSARALGGILRTGMGFAVQFVTQVVVLVLLARLLTPAEFGVVAASNVMVMLARLVIDTFLGSSLVVKERLGPRDVGSAFAASLAVGIATAGAMVAGAPLIEAGLLIEGVAPVTQALGLMFLVAAPGAVAQGLLRRDLRFGVAARSEAVASLLGHGALTLALAYAGWGLWAPVLGAIAHGVTRAVLMLTAVRDRLGLAVDLAAMRDLYGRGAWMALGEMAGIVANHSHTVIAARAFGPALLGVYDRAYRLAALPAYIYTEALSSVALASMSLVQNDQERLRAAFRRGFALTGLFGLPMAVALGAMAPEIIRIMLGAQWSGAVPVFQIFAASMPFRLAYRVSQTTVQARGKAGLVTLAQSVCAVIVIFGCLSVAPYGIEAVAGVVAVGQSMAFVLLTAFALREIRLGPGAALALWGPGALAGAALAALIGVVVVGLRPMGLPLATTGAALLAVAAWYALAAAAPRRWLWGEDGLWFRGQVLGAASRFLRVASPRRDG